MIRIATYNVEWFDNLFDHDGALLLDDRWSSRYNVTRKMQLEALKTVFTALDADAIMVIEAPDTSRSRETRRALEQFADWAGLRANTIQTGFISHTQQEIALMYDPLLLRVRHDPQGVKNDTNLPAFNTEFRADLGNGEDERAHFSKPPLELDVEHRVSGERLRLMGVHIKSKAPHGAKGALEVAQVSLENRRKQLAQSIWIRERVKEHLDANDPLIVLGDFNDGIGFDTFESLLGRSSIEVIMGLDAHKPEKELILYEPHALHHQRSPSNAPTSARFYKPKRQEYHSVLIDYVMVSQNLRSNASWRIWNPLEDGGLQANEALAQALLTASDHFPVSVDLPLG